MAPQLVRRKQLIECGMSDLRGLRDDHRLLRASGWRGSLLRCDFGYHQQAYGRSPVKVRPMQSGVTTDSGSRRCRRPGMGDGADGPRGSAAPARRLCADGAAQKGRPQASQILGWARLVSNQRPLACEASALPLSYAPGSGDFRGSVGVVAARRGEDRRSIVWLVCRSRQGVDPLRCAHPGALSQGI